MATEQAIKSPGSRCCHSVPQDHQEFTASQAVSHSTHGDLRAANGLMVISSPRWPAPCDLLESWGAVRG